MIKFFRKIRFTLMESGKTGRYFKYAVGEIILVVIGILIALQINNWNENTKKNKLKTSYISSLIDDYTKDTIQLNKSIAYNKLALQELDSIVETFSSDTLKLDDFISYFKSFSRAIRIENTFNTNSFNVLISTGNIDLFDKNLIKSLMELNRLQNFQYNTSAKNSDSFMELMSNCAENFPIFSVSDLFSENTNVQLWKTVELEKIPALTTNIIMFKRYLVRRYIELAQETNLKTEEVVSLLKQRLKTD